MSDDQKAALIPHQSGVRDLTRLIQCVKACGFDEHSYLTQNPGLRQAGFDPPTALSHFLTHGFSEHRDPVCGSMPDGLMALSALAIPDRGYARQLFQCLFFGQLRNPRTAEALWNKVNGEVIDCVRDQGGIPYFIIGDSHTNRYARSVWFETKWLAPFPMVCHGGSAIGLASKTSRSQYDKRILQWASDLKRSSAKFDVPVFLKFGGIDAEFLWISRRIEKAVHRFTVDEFDTFARTSVAAYGSFLDRLAGVIDRSLLRVCAVFPTVLADADWIDVYLQAHRGSPENNRRLAEALAQLEIPDFTARTRLRAVYNTHLRDMCAEKNLVFVDDFSPLLGADGNVHRRYVGADSRKDHHLDHDASEEALVAILRDFVLAHRR
jgi:hypothetical protein